jgi:pyruvate ferredoxin oxidoreductase gamma subunit
MFRIRFHGRGGQGIKTASRILGSAFFLAGYEVQDAPRYGAERRGAPIFAYVRADRKPIRERGIIRHPDLVVCADDSLLGVAAAGVLQGIRADSLVLVSSGQPPEVWRRRLNISASVLTLPPAATEDAEQLRLAGAECAGAAAALSGAVTAEQLTQAILQELSGLHPALQARNLELALAAFERLTPQRGLLHQALEPNPRAAPAPDWIKLAAESAEIAAPAIHATLTSERSQTGLWRSLRPEIDYSRCGGCWWVCSSACPDGAIALGADRRPQIDYDHCKGCLVCLAQCPPHAISARPEAKPTESGAAP